MSDQDYKILVSCRDILYPGGTEVFHYVAWAQNNGNSTRLGELGLGKVEFETGNAFSSIIVTKESSSRPRNPQGTIVMRGNRQGITLLDSTPDNVDSVNEMKIIVDQAEEVVVKKPNVFRQIATGGFLAFLGLVAVMIIVFVITRAR